MCSPRFVCVNAGPHVTTDQSEMRTYCIAPIARCGQTQAKVDGFMNTGWQKQAAMQYAYHAECVKRSVAYMPCVCLASTKCVRPDVLRRFMWSRDV